nr:MAG TPA: hypothetical protein [Caudoviricetes sp.]
MAGGQSREARKILRKKQNKKSGCSAVGSAPALGDEGDRCRWQMQGA